MTTETTIDPNPSPVDPAIVAAAIPDPIDPAPIIATDSAIDPAAVIDPAVDPAVDPKPHGNKGRKPWYLDRISEESEARRQAETRAQELEAMLERSRANPDPAAAAAPRSDDATVETRARQIAEETINNNTVRAVVSAGLVKFPDWDERMNVLGGAVGNGVAPGLALEIHAVDPARAHELLHALADDPQKAAHLAKMDTRTRTIELVKMSLAAQALATQGKPAAAAPANEKPLPPKTISKAPPPPPAIDPSAQQTVDWRTDPNISYKEFSERWDENAKRRAAIRR